MEADEGLPLPGALVLGALALGAAAQGGFYPGALAVMSGVAIASGVIAFHASRSLSAPAVAALAMGAWAVIAGSLGASVAAAVPTLVVSVALAAVLTAITASEPADRMRIVEGLLVVGALVALSGVIGVALHREPFAIPSQGLVRAATSLTYANAAASFLSMTSLMSVALLCVDNTRKRALVSMVNLAGLAATLSRGGYGAFFLGALVLLIVLRPRRVLAVSVAPAVGALAVVAGLAPSFLESRLAQPAIAAVGLAVGVLLTIWLATAPVRVRAIALSVAVAAVAGGVFAQGDVVDLLVRKRLNAVSPARTEEARAALRVVAADPLTGAGPGRAPLVWDDPNSGELLVAEYAHNEYLQTLADTGIVGGLTLVAFLLMLGRALAVARPRAPPALWAGAVAAAVSLLAHALLDFVWHVPVLPLVAAAFIGATLGEAVGEEESS